MGTLTYTNLVQVNFGKLGTAASDWKEVLDALKTLMEDARTGMLAKSDGAQWAGLNATVTRDFVQKAADEIADLHTEAKSIWSLLDDAHSELKALQKSVEGIVAEAKESKFLVTDNGDGTVRFAFDYGGSPRGAYSQSDQASLQKQADGYADRVNPKIAKAAGIDSDVKRGLAEAHGNSVHDAGHAKYQSLNDAQAEEAVELAAKGDAMTDKELAELNRLLGQNAKEKNGEFATKFYKGLGGPEKALEFYAQMSVQGTDDDASKTRLAAVQDLQRNMGFTLANATEPDAAKGLDGKKFHLPAGWGDEFRKLGTQPISWTPGGFNKPYGYQILGGMMRYGNYDPSFINPIAEHITQLHRDDPGRFLNNRPTSGDDNYGFNPSGKLGSGNDPLNSVLEALGHSPEASTQFFTEEPTKYNEDGTVDKNGDPGFNSYLEEFTKEDFQWNIDRNNANLVGSEDVEAALNDGPNALGHALEAATTGRPYDSDATADAIKHTPERAALVNDIVETFGQDPALIRHNENGDLDEDSGPLYAMRDSLGDITAEYMGDFQQAMYNEGASDDFPTFGARADLNNGMAQRFLAEVGQDPDAYASITGAQQAYTSNLVDNVINGGSDSTASLDGRIRDIVTPGGAIAGIMSEARADAVIDYKTANDAAFNSAVDDKAKWVDRIVGMGVDNTAGRVPIAGDVVGWISEDIQSSVVESIYQDSADDAENDAAHEYAKGREAVGVSAEQAVRNAAMNSDLSFDTVEDLERAARTGAELGHGDGAKWESSGDAD